MPFFPTYKDNWTRTPNVFFDEILKTDGVSLNEIRIIGYLVRQTLGYNKEAKWIGVTRSQLINEAKVSKGNLTKALDKCIRKEWILSYEEGEGTQKKRYIFLNDERNQRIVEKLKAKQFTINHLLYLNEAGIDNLLKLSDLITNNTTTNENKRSSIESIQEQIFPSIESVQATSIESIQATSIESVQADDTSTQADQGIAEPLKTIDKYSIKYNVVVELFRKHMDVDIIKDEAEMVLEEATRYHKDVEQAILETVRWAEMNGEKLINPVGSVIYGIQKGWNLNKQSYKSKASPTQLADTRSVVKKPAKKLPRSVQLQMDLEAGLIQLEDIIKVSPEELAAQQARIQAKLRMLDEPSATKNQEENPNSHSFAV